MKNNLETPLVKGLILILAIMSVVYAWRVFFDVIGTGVIL